MKGSKNKLIISIENQLYCVMDGHRNNQMSKYSGLYKVSLIHMCI